MYAKARRVGLWSDQVFGQLIKQWTHYAIFGFDELYDTCGHNNNKVGLEVGRAGVPVVLFVLLISFPEFLYVLYFIFS